MSEQSRITSSTPSSPPPSSSTSQPPLPTITAKPFYWPLLTPSTKELLTCHSGLWKLGYPILATNAGEGGRWLPEQPPLIFAASFELGEVMRYLLSSGEERRGDGSGCWWIWGCYGVGLLGGMRIPLWVLMDLYQILGLHTDGQSELAAKKLPYFLMERPIYLSKNHEFRVSSDLLYWSNINTIKNASI